MDTAFTVGRKSCTVNLDDFSLRPTELGFSMMNGVWLIRSPDPLATVGWELGVPGVFLAGNDALGSRQSSNRLRMRAGH